jgi:hypothetical protein
MPSLSWIIGLIGVGALLGGILHFGYETFRRQRLPKSPAGSGFRDDWDDIGDQKGPQEFKQWPKKKLHLPKSVISLQGVPEDITHVEVTSAGNLAGLEGLPTSVRQLLLYGCGPFQNLRGLPASLKRIRIWDCQSLNSLEGLPEGVEVVALCHLNNLKSFRGLPTTIKTLIFPYCPVTDLNGVPSGLDYAPQEIIWG